MPQLLQMANILLYFEAAFAILSLLNVGIGDSAYYFLGAVVGSSALVQVVVLAAAGAYVYAGWGIANEQKKGWQIGVVVAVGSVALPWLAPGTLFHYYLFSYLFNVALVVLLLHRDSREHQRIWFS